MTVAWVAKGIMYDTGGLSLKVGGAMVGMKSDMAAAAAMLSAFGAAVRLGARQRIHLLLCLAENAIGNGALRNDDVLRLFSDKTVEINNTDAEGRLVLGDGVRPGIRSTAAAAGNACCCYCCRWLLAPAAPAPLPAVAASNGPCCLPTYCLWVLLHVVHL